MVRYNRPRHFCGRSGKEKRDEYWKGIGKNRKERWNFVDNAKKFGEGQIGRKMECEIPDLFTLGTGEFGINVDE